MIAIFIICVRVIDVFWFVEPNFVDANHPVLKVSLFRFHRPDRIRRIVAGDVFPNVAPRGPYCRCGLDLPGRAELRVYLKTGARPWKVLTKEPELHERRRHWAVFRIPAFGINSWLSWHCRSFRDAGAMFDARPRGTNVLNPGR